MMKRVMPTLALLLLPLSCMAQEPQILERAVPTHDKTNVSQASQPQSKSDLLAAKQKLFLEYERDLEDFGKSHSGTDVESDVLLELDRIAGETFDFLQAGEIYAQIYDRLSCKNDRAAIKLLLEKQFSYYEKRLDLFVSGVNHQLTFIKTPALATEGIRMREDLREAKSLLESITFD